MSMTAQEQKVLDLTVELWNAFLDLPEYHPSERAEMARDIHDIQQRVMARVAVRQNPGYFTGAGKL